MIYDIGCWMNYDNWKSMHKYMAPMNIYQFFETIKIENNMENKEFLPVYTTDAYKEVGKKLEYDANAKMYVYRERNDEIGEGYESSSTNVWGVSPELVEQYVRDGFFTYTNPLAIPEPTSGIVYSDEDALAQCECDNEESFEESVNHRLYHLEDKIGQILELLNNKKVKK